MTRRANYGANPNHRRNLSLPLLTAAIALLAAFSVVPNSGADGELCARLVATENATFSASIPPEKEVEFGVRVGAAIATRDGTVMVEFRDGTVLVLKDGTQIVLGSFARSSLQPLSHVIGLQLKTGRFRVIPSPFGCEIIVNALGNRVFTKGALDIMADRGFLDVYAPDGADIELKEGIIQLDEGCGYIVSPEGNDTETDGRPPALLEPLQPWKVDAHKGIANNPPDIHVSVKRTANRFSLSAKPHHRP
ncbi:MAG: hypothetical protein U5N86_08240 [Planctomycetota bacterium]|nr:hypothetical protein [Planctomycetota bacterium]